MARACGFDALYVDMAHAAMSVEAAGQKLVLEKVPGADIWMLLDHASVRRAMDDPASFDHHVCRVHDCSALPEFRPDLRAHGFTHADLSREVAKGASLDDIEVSKDELDDIALESTRTIEIDEFVPRSDIDSRYLIRPYYLVPDGKVGLSGVRLAFVARLVVHDEFAGLRVAAHPRFGVLRMHRQRERAHDEHEGDREAVHFGGAGSLSSTTISRTVVSPVFSAQWTSGSR